MTSHPQGVLQIKKCSGDFGCLGNIHFKSIVVCAPDRRTIKGYSYSISVPIYANGSRVRLTPGLDIGYNSDAELYGATATTLLTSNDRCREILIRFWSIPEGVSNAVVRFAVYRKFIVRNIEIFRTSFLVSYTANDTPTTPTPPTGI